MIVYFVRHGESEHNAKRIHQPSDSPLSDSGLKQAKQLASRFKNVPIDVILTSPYKRTMQTSEIISDELKLEFEMEPHLVEMRRPSEIINKSWDDPDIRRIKNTIFENWIEPNYHYSDEENFFELKERAGKAISKILTIDGSHVLVVSHGHLIGMIVCLLTFGEDLKPDEYLKIRNMFSLSNSGITTLKYESAQWKLISWNDVAHVAV